MQEKCLFEMVSPVLLWISFECTIVQWMPPTSLLTMRNEQTQDEAREFSY